MFTFEELSLGVESAREAADTSLAFAFAAGAIEKEERQRILEFPFEIVPENDPVPFLLKEAFYLGQR